MSEHLIPLSAVLDNVLARLASVEAKLGVTTITTTTTSSSSTQNNTVVVAIPKVVVEDEEVVELHHPRLVAFDAHISQSLLPFTSTCTSLGSDMDGIGTYIHTIWLTMRNIIELGTLYQKPFDPDNNSAHLLPQLRPCQDAMASIRSAKLDRKFDYHIKAILEMLSCVSWIVLSSPPSPSIFVKDTIGASDFWANKIRKEYKDKRETTGGEGGEVHIQFCDKMKALIMDLSMYLKEHHLSGLAWNANGKVDFASAKVVVVPTIPSSTLNVTDATSRPTTASSSAAVVASAGGDHFLAELKKKQTGDGSSAATGLKKVTKDQQTWRKEYNKNSAPPAPISMSTVSLPSSSSVKNKLLSTTAGPPKCEYQERGCKWTIENQTKENCDKGVCKVTITDAKQQVYIYNCQNVTIQITGKLKSIIIDSCKKVGVVFDTAISACEVVNCTSVQVQSTNLCPSFSIDKTDGIVVHLTNEAVSQSMFVTSKSSEMNVSWVDDNGEIREAPIPEQFMHKLVNGSITSQVSDLYH